MLDNSPQYVYVLILRTCEYIVTWRYCRLNVTKCYKKCNKGCQSTVFLIFFLFIKFIGMTLVSKIMQVSGAEFHSTSSIYCIVCSPPQINSPSITIYPPYPSKRGVLYFINLFFYCCSVIVICIPPPQCSPLKCKDPYRLKVQG